MFSICIVWDWSVTGRQVKGKRSAKRQLPCSVTTFFNSLPILCRVTWGLHLRAQSKFVHCTSTCHCHSEAVDPGHHHECIWSRRGMYVRNETVFKAGFQPNRAGHKSSWASGGGGGGGGEEEGGGCTLGGRLITFQQSRETNASNFFLLSSFKWTVCVDYITREKACDCRKTAKDQKNEWSFLRVYNTLVSKYLGAPVHVNDVKGMDEALPVYTENNRQLTSKQTNKGCMNNTTLTIHDKHLKPNRDLQQLSMFLFKQTMFGRGRGFSAVRLELWKIPISNSSSHHHFPKARTVKHPGYATMHHHRTIWNVFGCPTSRFF